MKHGRKTPVDESGAYPSPYDAYLHGLSATTRRRMSAALRRAAKILSVDPEKCVWNKLEPDQVALVRDELTAQGASPTTINVALSAIRGVARAACGRDPDALTREEIGRLEAIRSIQNVPVKRDSAPGRALGSTEMRALFTACLRDHSTAGLRDAAMLLSLYSTGMTCRELVGLEPGDWGTSPPSLLVGAKTNVERKVLLGSRTSEVVAVWLAVRGKRQGRMFLPLGTDQTISGQRLTERTVLQVIKKRARGAALGPVFAEDLRHSAIKALFDAGAGYHVVRHIVGPIGLATLARYDSRDTEPLSATQCIHPTTPAHNSTPYHRWQEVAL